MQQKKMMEFICLTVLNKTATDNRNRNAKCCNPAQDEVQYIFNYQINGAILVAYLAWMIKYSIYHLQVQCTTVELGLSGNSAYPPKNLGLLKFSIAQKVLM